MREEEEYCAISQNSARTSSQDRLKAVCIYKRNSFIISVNTQVAFFAPDVFYVQNFAFIFLLIIFFELRATVLAVSSWELQSNRVESLFSEQEVNT